MSAVTDSKHMETHSTPEQTAEVVYEAATDGKGHLRCVAGADVMATYAARLLATRRSATRCGSDSPEQTEEGA
jgi:hypothetical protein